VRQTLTLSWNFVQDASDLIDLTTTYFFKGFYAAVESPTWSNAATNMQTNGCACGLYALGPCSNKRLD
jgi:hypothetical protein